MKKTNLRLLGVLLLALFPLKLLAADIKPLFLAGFELGGDTLVSVTYTDGTDAELDAGDGFVLGGGAIIPLNEDGMLSSRITLSWKYNSLPAATNGSGDFTRFPLDFSIHKRFEQHFIGAGLTYHLNPKFSASGVLGNGSVSFDNALGMFLQYDYSIGDKYGFGLRYTKLEYDLDVGGYSADASSFGLFFSSSL